MDFESIAYASFAIRASHGSVASPLMALRRRSRVRRLTRRLLVLGGVITGVTALRNRALASSERRHPDLLGPPTADAPPD